MDSIFSLYLNEACQISSFVPKYPFQMMKGQEQQLHIQLVTPVPSPRVEKVDLKYLRFVSAIYSFYPVYTTFETCSD